MCLQLSIILDEKAASKGPRERIRGTKDARKEIVLRVSSPPATPLADVLFISSFDAPAAVPFAFGSRAPPSMHHRTWTSPKRNKFQIRSLLLFALSLMRRVEPWAVCIGHDAKRGVEGPFHFIHSIIGDAA